MAPIRKRNSYHERRDELAASELSKQSVGGIGQRDPGDQMGKQG